MYGFLLLIHLFIFKCRMLQHVIKFRKNKKALKSCKIYTVDGLNFVKLNFKFKLSAIERERATCFFLMLENYSK